MNTIRTRVNRTERVWRRHIQEWQNSGLSQRDYCERAGLALSTFTLWRGRLQARTASTAASMVPQKLEIVPVAKLSQVQDVAPLVLVLDSGRFRLEIPEGVHVNTLRNVVRALEELR